ncbi:MAG: helix-turn-helix transcriptional regulator [Crocinitomicaceae bacterium]
MLIQDRIRTIMKSGNHSASEFADKIGVKRSNLSHVLSGRNKPSLDFLEKVINAYPKVNASWLITGEMRSETAAPKATPVESKPQKTQNSSNEKEVEKILLFYKDGTFDTYTPNQQ